MTKPRKQSNTHPFDADDLEKIDREKSYLRVADAMAALAPRAHLPGSMDHWHAALSREYFALSGLGDDEGLRRYQLADAIREESFNRLVDDLLEHGLGDYADALVTGDYSRMKGASSGDIDE